MKKFITYRIYCIKNIFTFYFILWNETVVEKEVENERKMIVPKNVRTIIKVLRGCNNRFPFRMALTLSNRAIVKFSHPSHPPSLHFRVFSPFFIALFPNSKGIRYLDITYVLYILYIILSFKMKENCTAFHDISTIH